MRHSDGELEPVSHRNPWNNFTTTTRWLRAITGGSSARLTNRMPVRGVWPRDDPASYVAGLALDKPARHHFHTMTTETPNNELPNNELPKIQGITANDHESLELIREALEARENGELSNLACLIVIDSFARQVPISEEDLKRAHEITAQHPEWSR